MAVVVAGTYTKSEKEGTFNIQTSIRSYCCNSEKEGVGIFVKVEESEEK